MKFLKYSVLAVGLFAGVSISGSVLDIDEKSNNSFYGEDIDAKTIFVSNKNISAETVTSQKNFDEFI